MTVTASSMTDCSWPIKLCISQLSSFMGPALWKWRLDTCLPVSLGTMSHQLAEIAVFDLYIIDYSSSSWDSLSSTEGSCVMADLLMGCPRTKSHFKEAWARPLCLGPSVAFYVCYFPLQSLNMLLSRFLSLPGWNLSFFWGLCQIFRLSIREIFMLGSHLVCVSFCIWLRSIPYFASGFESKTNLGVKPNKASRYCVNVPSAPNHMSLSLYKGQISSFLNLSNSKLQAEK